MIRMSAAAMAMSSSRWMNPPRVYELTTPSTHRASRMKKTVHSMEGLLGVDRHDGFKRRLGLRHLSCQGGGRRVGLVECRMASRSERERPIVHVRLSGPACSCYTL